MTQSGAGFVSNGTIQHIAVIGAGLMGHGIAQEFAVAGFSVCLYDLTEELLEKAIQRIRNNLELLSGQGLISEAEIEEAWPRLRTSPQLEEAVHNADLVVEAVSEDLPLKLQLFSELDRLCPKHTILASNTSTFMPGLLAAATQRPDRVLIAHYFNPPYLLPLVEVVCCSETSTETKNTVVALLKGIGKRPVEIGKEVPGFVGNRLQMALIREAFHIVQEGIASPWEVDAVVRDGFGRRLAVAGPFEIGESAGWDLWKAIAEQLLPTLSNAVEAPALLEQQVAKGELGIKSGKGFYTWGSEEVSSLRQRMAHGLLEMSRWEAKDETAEGRAEET
jgi:3-hydroxybutyryl-CoA dehydrogenase